MKAEPASASYAKLKARIDQFFDSSFTELVSEAEKEFQKPVINWLKDVHKDLLNKKSGDSNLYKASIYVLDEKLSSLESVIKSIERHSRFNTAADLLLQKLEDVSVEITENQAEDRFQRLADDSFITGLKKSVKRHLRHFTSLTGKNKWHQKINLRDLLTEELFSEPDWMEIWIAESFKDTTEILDLFLEKEESGDTDGIDSEDKESFYIEIVNKFEKHLEHAIKRVESEEILSNEELESQLLKMKDRITERSVRAGTIEGSRPKLRYEAVKTKIDKQEKRFRELEASWINYLNSQAADLRIQTEIAGYGYMVSEVQKKILNESHLYFRDFGYVPMENGISSSREIADELVKHKSGKLSNKLIESIRRKVDMEIKEAILAPMRDLSLQHELMDRIRSHISDLQLELTRFSESVQLAEERETIMPKPLVRYDKLQWRSLASRFLQEKVLREMAPEKMLLVEFISEMAAEVEETIQIVDVNLMAAIESKSVKEEVESPLEIALGGVQRAINLFEKSIKRVREKQNEYEKIIRINLPDTLHQLADTMLRREYDKFELQDKALQVKQRATDWKVWLDRYLLEFAEKGKLFWRFVSQKFKKGKIVVYRFQGVKDKSVMSSTEKRNLTEYLSRSSGQATLPFIYKRLFDPDFEIDSRFYAAPKGLFTTVEIAYNEWKKGLDSNVILLGEKGSGKSTAIRFIKERYFNEESIFNVQFDKTIFTEEKLIRIFAIALELDEITSLDELIEMILNRKNRSVIIVENLHNVYVKNIHGFEALESFWILMSVTREKLFWLVSTSRCSWNFFEKMSDADQYFSHYGATDTLDRDQLLKAVMDRHKATGYNLKFEPGQLLKNSRSFRKLMDDEVKKQEYLKEYYFTRLSNIAEGNLSIAIIFWLQSISDFDQNTFYMQPLEVADVDKLEVPSRNVLFTLAAFVIHDKLTEEEMALALHKKVPESSLMLARLKSKGIIVKTKNGYLMNHLVYRQVIRLLKRRNIIH